MKINSRPVLFALLGCVAIFSVPSGAQAARFQQYLNGVCKGLRLVRNLDGHQVEAAFWDEGLARKLGIGV